MKMFLMCVIKEKLGKHLDVIIELENENRIIWKCCLKVLMASTE